MAALELDKLTWPEVEAELKDGRDTVVVAFGATEQHGLHMPLATDALIGDELARAVADRIDAFVAPTVRVGCSSHHLDFPGTLSLEDETFHAIVRDLVSSLARGGFGALSCCRRMAATSLRWPRPWRGSKASRSLRSPTRRRCCG